MFTQLTLSIFVFFSGALAHAGWQCPKAHDPNRNAALQKIFQTLKPDPLNGKTIEEQRSLFSCLEKLITQLSDKKVATENISSLVLYATKAAQYQNDLYAAEYLAELGQTLFAPHRAAANRAVKQLRKTQTISADEEATFREMTNLKP